MKCPYPTLVLATEIADQSLPTYFAGQSERKGAGLSNYELAGDNDALGLFPQFQLEVCGTGP